MKIITFSAIFYLALGTIQALGMEEKSNQPSPAVSPATSVGTINFDSASTSPITSMVNSPITPIGAIDFKSLSDSSPQSKKRNYDLDESDCISWQKLDRQVAQNYGAIKHIFSKITNVENPSEKSAMQKDSKEKDLPKKLPSAKPKKKVRIQDYNDSSSDDDSDIECMLNSL